ncbi:MAG: AEC family transporter [Candidatus Krumholzibacteriia bacterium]
MMVLDSLLPVFALIGLGALLRRRQLTNDLFLRTSDRLVYYIFFPVMLFWKIGASPRIDADAADLVLAGLVAVASVYAVSAVAMRVFRIPRFTAGSFSQSCYRFNTYVGMAVVLNALGEPGAARFGILAGFLIPFINVLAVGTLIWYSDHALDQRERIRITLRALVSNPLILACLAGLVYARLVGRFPVFLDNAFGLASSVALPLALVSVGGSLTLRHFRAHLGHAVLGSVIKLAILPAVGWLALSLVDASPLSRQVGLLFCALPTSPAIVVLSSQLGSDTEFASAAIVLSTLLSFVAMSVVLLSF